MAAPPGLPPPEELLKKAEEYLRELEKGPWPSHISELRKTGYPLHVYGCGLVARKSPWGPSAVKTKRLTGVMARIAREWVPGGGEEVHVRVFQTPGKFYPTDHLRKILKIVKEYGIGLLEVTGQTSAMVINTKGKEAVEKIIDALREIGTDVGGSGDAIRELAACVGPALCEFALFDTLQWLAEFRKDRRVHDHIAVPGFPYKFKLKFSGCPFDCARANRADFGLMGVWKGAPEVDQELLKEKIKAGEVDPKALEANCPSRAITWDGKELKIDGTRCKRSMQCIRAAYPAIKPGKERRIAVLVGGGSKGNFGAKLGWFIGYLKPDLSEVKKAADLMFKLIELWDSEAPPKHRFGDYILSTGLSKLIEKAGIDLEDTPKFVEKIPDSVPYRVLPEAERNKFAEFAEKVRQIVKV